MLHGLPPCPRTFADIERLALSPQCGFASVAEGGNRLSASEQFAKLRLVADTARLMSDRQASRPGAAGPRPRSPRDPRRAGQRGLADLWSRTAGPMEMENAAADYACLLNDVFYQKEIQFEGEIHNAVLVVRNFLDCDAAEAMRITGGLANARMRQFQHILAAEIPVLFDTLHLGTDARRAINGHARHPKNWLSGILNWHEGCHRYAESDLISNSRPAQSALSGWRTGLGTSAARIGHAP